MDLEHEVVLYQIDGTNVCVNVFFKDETFWMTQKAMAELFDCSIDNIGLHLKNIFCEDELDENSTTEDFSVVQLEGTRKVKRKIKFYNLDAIIAVGYRVNSKKAIDYAELMAEDGILMSMKDWALQTDTFLLSNRRNVLNDKGKISHDNAIHKAEKEYAVFRIKQDHEYISEFDRTVEQYLKGN